MKFELDYIERLVKLVSENKITEFSIEEGDKAILIKKEKELVTTHVSSAISHHVPSISASHVEVAEVSEVTTKGVPITSPMVGTFYSAPSPGSTSFTEIGKIVNVGQTVCIIEAMKLMNEIESDVAGKVIEICVQDGQPVEYGQVLMIIEP